MPSHRYSRFCAAWKCFSASEEWLLDEEKFFEFMTSEELGSQLGFGAKPADFKASKLYRGKTWEEVVRGRCQKLNMLPDDDGFYFFDDAASGLAQLLLIRSMDLSKVSGQ